MELCDYYCDLQIHKHVNQEERVPRLEKWFDDHQNKLPEMEWYEFSACSGSTLGIFCLISYAMREDFRGEDADNIVKDIFHTYRVSIYFWIILLIKKRIGKAAT